MKKIFLLLVSAIAISTSFAQYKDSDRDMAVNTVSTIVDSRMDYSSSSDNTYYSETYVFKATDKNLQSVKINKYYDNLVQSVKAIGFVNADVKAGKIAELDAQRRIALNKVNAKFFNQKNLADHRVKWVNDVYDINRHNL